MWAASPGRALRTGRSHRAHRSLDMGAATGDYRAVRGAAGAASGGTPRPTTKGAFDGGQPQPRSRRRHRPALALAPRAARRRGRGPARRWPGGLRRQRLVVVRRSGGGSTPAAGTPKKGGNFRLGVTGGGASDIIDGQSIVTKPDQTRLIGSWETLMTYNEDYVLGTDGLAEEVDSSVPGQVDVRLRSGIEFHNGKTLTADDVIYSIKRILNPKEGLFGAAGLGLRRSEQAHEDGRQHGADRAEAARLHHPRPARPVLQRHRARRLRAQGRPEVGRDGPVQDPELHAGPAERGRPERELLAAGLRRAVVRPGHGHRLRRLRGPGERPARRPAGCHHRHPVRPDRHRQGAGASRSSRVRAAAGCRSAWRSTSTRSPTSRCARRSGSWPTARRCWSRCCRATAASRTTSSRRSTRATRPTWRSASRTSSRPSRCSSRPARTA